VVKFAPIPVLLLQRSASASRYRPASGLSDSETKFLVSDRPILTPNGSFPRILAEKECPPVLVARARKWKRKWKTPNFQRDSCMDTRSAGEEVEDTQFSAGLMHGYSLAASGHRVSWNPHRTPHSSMQNCRIAGAVRSIGSLLESLTAKAPRESQVERSVA
jgi:hypothetical protein